jgi:hypothetical protein
MVALRSCVIALVAVLSACDVGVVPATGGGPDGGTTDSGVTTGSQAVFDSTIKPMVMTKGCLMCHVTTVQPPNFSSYQTLDPKYRSGPVGTNILLNEAADGAQHNGVTYFTTAEKMTIKNWILGN